MNGTIINGTTIEINEYAERSYFPIASQCIALVFVIFVSIIIMNLLFGLAVADIQVKNNNFLKFKIHLETLVTGIGAILPTYVHCAYFYRNFTKELKLNRLYSKSN